MSVKEDLQALDALLSSEDKWTTKAYARDVRGIDCDTFSPRAVSWCLEGAIFKVAEGSDDLERRAQFLRGALLNATAKLGKPTMSLIILNDHREDFAGVKAVIAKAIEEAA